MRIVHFASGNVAGGAARGAYFLHNSLCSIGINSEFFIVDKFQADSFSDIRYLCNDTQGKLKHLDARHLEKYILARYPQRKKDIFSVGRGIYDDYIIEISKQADIVHLHWINDQMLSIEALSRINKPIVWTFRDMWPFTGGCHYSGKCTNYKKSCGSCSFLGSDVDNDISNWIISRKKKNYRNIYPVALSNWLAECANESYLFRDQNVTVIPNCIDTTIFKPHDKSLARERLNLPDNKKIIAFGAINALADKRKGFDHLVEALNHLVDKEYYHLVSFGSSNVGSMEKIGIKYTSFGIVNDDSKLSEIYSAADVFVAPSLEEAFGKTIIEAMACGTPVIAYNATGPKDIIKHKKSGFLAKAFDTSELANGIMYIVNHYNYNQIREHAITRVQTLYSAEFVSNQYIDLYQKILNDSIGESIINSEESSDYFLELEKNRRHDIENVWRNENKWIVFVDKSEELLKRIGNKRIAIYGTGSFGQEVYEILNYYHIYVDVFIDSDASKHGLTILNHKISSLMDCKECFIFIASTWYEEIETLMLSHGFKKSDYVIAEK